MTDVEIVSQVNAEIRGMYNYYSIAENATVIKNFAFILEYSMYKTFGLKYQKSVYKIQRKYRKNGIFMVPYNTKNGLKYCEFYHDGFKKKRYACSFEPDLLPQYVKYDNPNYLRTRIKLGVCELCGKRQALCRQGKRPCVPKAVKSHVWATAKQYPRCVTVPF